MKRSSIVISIVWIGGLVAGSVATYLVLRAPSDPYSTYKPSPDLPKEVNDALSYFTDLGNRQFRWTEDDWERVKGYATDEQAKAAIRTAAIYQVGEQAGCDKCMAEPRKSNWTAILNPMLEHADEYIRAAALQTLYTIGAREPRKSMADDPSEVVRYTWKMTYGRGK